jgi:REP element-mobilizing transposase RayT
MAASMPHRNKGPKGRRDKARGFSPGFEPTRRPEVPEGRREISPLRNGALPSGETGALRLSSRTISALDQETFGGSMASTFSNLLYHLVFATKNRLPLIQENLRDDLYGYMGGILRGEGGVLLEIGGMPDHVHLLVKLRTDVAVSTVVQKVKAKSSKRTNEREASPERFEWQEGYGIFSVSESLASRVRRYIRGQQEHHARVSFRDEMIALLKKHRIPYDENFLLG